MQGNHCGLEKGTGILYYRSMTEIRINRPQTIAVKITKDAERQLRSGHPWIYDRSIVKQNKKGSAGDICIIYGQEKNQMIGIGLYDPYSSIVIKILDLGKGIALDDTYWTRKVEMAFQMRKPLLESNTNGYRLIYGENDGLPGLIADVYDHTLVIKLYSAMWYPYLEEVVSALNQVIEPEAIVLRLSRKLIQQNESSAGWEDGKVISGLLEHEEVQFREHGLLFQANVVKGHKTGYFLDHRHNRFNVGLMAKGRTVLDVFSYAGGFTVHALAGGAKHVTSLDISAQAQSMAKKNVSFNKGTGRHSVIIGDAFEEMQKMISAETKFDIVVIDPPTFASKKSQITKALYNYKSLVILGCKLVERGGVLVMASCSSRIKADEFYRLVDATLRNHGKWKVLEKTGHDIDHPIAFPEAAYLKCAYYRILPF